MIGRPKWRRATSGELSTIEQWLARWPDPQLGPARHMFALACLDSMGPDVARVATDGDDWAVCVVHPARTLVPAGHAGLFERLGAPTRRWRMVIGDVDACRPLVAPDVAPSNALVHHQRFMLLDDDRLPSADAMPDPGVRPAVDEDLDALVDLATHLHRDDEFGPVTGAVTRGYRSRMQSSLAAGQLRVVGPVGAPVAKLERSVASPRRGVQLAGIVVVPDQRSRGLGRAFVAAAAREARSEARGLPISLHVRAANTPAIRAYLACGFVDTEEWRLAIRP